MDTNNTKHVSFVCIPHLATCLVGAHEQNSAVANGEFRGRDVLNVHNNGERMLR